ncbi:hypothetical protein BU17DRAFT_40150 [Hysterangium stoloniferum]|nr:hypothetical protein BU17DRAFT_40150 [Hysterangium stoloniferum]
MSNRSSDSNYKLCAIAIPDDEKKDLVSKESILGRTDESVSIVPASFAVLAKTSLLWPNGSTINYFFLDGTDHQRAKFNQVVHQWEPYANIVSQLAADAGSSDVRISFNSESGSWSYVGIGVKKKAKDVATMNLGWIRDTEDLSDDEHGVILHEWGHTLGLMHEHQSPLRGQKLTLDEAKVYAYYMRTQGWSKATVKSQIIDVYNQQDVSNYSDVDLKSIMMYFMPWQLNLQHIEVGINNQLSDMDKAYMTINYPRSSSPEGAPDWTLEHALKIAGVDEAGITVMKNNAGDFVTDPTNLRSEFTAYIMSQRSLNPVMDARHRSEGGKWCGKTSLPLSEKSPEDVQRGFGRGDKLWPPHTTLNYCFLEGSTPRAFVTSLRRERVRTALDLYEKYTSIKFIYVEASDFDFSLSKDRDACPIRISFGDAVTDPTTDETTYGWAYYGTDHNKYSHDPDVDPYDGGEKWSTVFLGAQPLNDTDNVNINSADMTLYHELGHVLDLEHEHISPESLVDETPVEKGLTAYMVATLFDEDSVMLYDDLQFKNEEGKRTKLNTKPSPTDLYLLSLLYPDSGEADGKFAAALKAFDFTNTQTSLFLDDAKAALSPNVDPDRVRNLRIAIAANFNTTPRLAVETALEEPLEAAEAPVPGGTRISGFLLELMDALNQFFSPGGDQTFTLQFPGRYLSQTEYAWDTSSAGIYGQFVKPVSVNEAEFRLTDQLYDLASTVAGPNGINLSIVYEQLLNNLFPKFVSNGLSKQQEQLRQWLLKDVPLTPWVEAIMKRQADREKVLSDAFSKTNAPDAGASDLEVTPPEDRPSFAPTPGKMFDLSSKGKDEALNRLELSEILMGEYLYAKQDWELERDALITQATQALDALTRKLAHITATRQAQLATKYSDAVVRGRTHTVREYMGYLDIASPAEALQAAKDSLRESAMSSLNGAMKVYPVHLTPIDWFEGLSTSFQMEDLTSDPEIIRTAIEAKSQQLDVLNSQLVTLEMGATGDPTQLKAAVASAQKDLDTAQSTLAQTYANNVIEVAKTCLDENGKVDVGLVSKKVRMAQAVLAQLPAQMESVRVAQDKLTSTSRALSQLMAAHALAVATDTKEQQQQIRLRINSLTQDLTELQTRWKVLTAGIGGVKVVKTDTSTATLNPEEPVRLPEDSSSGGSRWQTIRLTSSTESRTNRSNADSNASSEQWSLNLWLASGSGSSSSSHAFSAAAATASKDTVDLAFRATLVTIDRGGWFQPQFFKQSKAYYKVNRDISWVNGDNGVKGLLPGYPVAFLIAKDIVIRVTHATSSSDEMKRFDESSSSSSGGVLCFSYSRSESASSQEAASNFQAYSNGFVVKIPGPQILGYMIQKTDDDQSILMPTELPDDFFIPDEDYNSTLGGGDKPANAPKEDPAKSPASNTISADKLREVVTKMVGDRLNDIISQTSPALPPSS